jgi:predicted  nucleic acid-binding Zn-ribbon protein
MAREALVKAMDGLAKQIELQRDAVLRHERLVDEARAQLECAVAGLQEAVRDRDRTAAHLNKLIAWFDEEECA